MSENGQKPTKVKTVGYADSEDCLIATDWTTYGWLKAAYCTVGNRVLVLKELSECTQAKVWALSILGTIFRLSLRWTV